MKLLVVTQVVDTRDPVLGFFHEWVSELASRFDSIEVICLKEGQHALPANVRVHSLGKEKDSKPSYIYAMRFLSLAWKLRARYDAVFVHMNQEYVLLAGLLWKLFSKRVYMWRNHYAGSLLTDLAAMYCTKVFYTSKSSYTARYPHALQMPVGVDTKRFFPQELERVPRSVLFLARMSPSKRPEVLLEALEMLAAKGVEFSATFAGSPLKEHEAYYRALVAQAKHLPQITFTPSTTHTEAAKLFRTHQVFVNASPSGMLDKTIFEAAASGCMILASSEDVKEMFGAEYYFADAQALAKRIEEVLTEHSQVPPVRVDEVVSGQSLASLGAILSKTIHD